MNEPEVKFTLRLADGRWVSSSTNTVTDNANLAGVFSASDEEAAAELRDAMDQLHARLKIVPRQSKRTNSVSRRVESENEPQDPFAGGKVHYAYTRKDVLNDGVQIDVSPVAREAGLKFPVYLTRAVLGDVRARAGRRAQPRRKRSALGCGLEGGSIRLWGEPQGDRIAAVKALLTPTERTGIRMRCPPKRLTPNRPLRAALKRHDGASSSRRQVGTRPRRARR
jgi:hypothetical protein